jgi:hypothetical protein
MAVYGCDYATNIGDVFLSVQKYVFLVTNIGLGLSALDAKLGEKKWPMRTPRSVHTQFVRA